MAKDSRIICNVSDCAHNCIKDCTCRLEQINVCPCTNDGVAKSEDGTACNSYNYAGDLNVEEIIGKD